MHLQRHIEVVIGSGTILEQDSITSSFLLKLLLISASIADNVGVDKVDSGKVTLKYVLS